MCYNKGGGGGCRPHPISPHFMISSHLAEMLIVYSHKPFDLFIKHYVP